MSADTKQQLTDSGCPNEERLLLGFLDPATEMEEAMRSILTSEAAQPVGPYSQAILATPGDFLSVSGQLGLDIETSALVKGGVKEEAKQALRSIEAILAAAGMRKEHVTKTTIFLRNLDDFALVNSLYEAFFGGHKPARSTIEVARLPKGGSVEIEAFAVKERNRRGRSWNVAGGR
jgi:2-iminobutanoate/2-iminopropanoate deaminase